MSDAAQKVVFCIPAPHERSKDYRRAAQELARDAVKALPTEEAVEWPANVVETFVTSVGTECKHTTARLVVNMFKGLIYRKSAIMRGVDFRPLMVSDDGPHFYVVMRKVD